MSNKLLILINMRYSCNYPNCEYSTNDRSLIEYHHIIPKELKGVDKDYNRIWLCPNHHKRIFVEGSEYGYHAIKNADSIIIKNKLTSTKHNVLYYHDCLTNKDKFDIIKCI